MKKILLLTIPVLALMGCAKEAGGKLPEPPEGSYTAVLEASVTTLTSEDSTEPIRVSLISEENSDVKYEVEIGAPVYVKTVSTSTGESYQEMVVKNGAYFKSISTYKVSKIACDIFEGKGINYEVHNTADGSGEALERHESSLTSTYAEDSGAVYEYEINSNAWSVTNTSNYKPTFYSVIIYFEIA